MASLNQWTGLSKLQETVKDSEYSEGHTCCSPGDCRVRHDLATEQQQMASCCTDEPYNNSGLCQCLWFHHVLPSLCSLSSCHTALFLNMPSSLCFVTLAFAASSSGNLFLFQLCLAGRFLANKSQLKSQPSENFPQLANQCSSLSVSGHCLQSI